MRKLVKIAGIIVGGFFLLAVIAAIVGNDGETTPSHSAGTRSGTTTVTNTVSTQHDDRKSSSANDGITKIGTRFVLGDLAYTVHGYRTTSVIGDPDLLGARAEPGATFVIVDFTIENNGTESDTVVTDDFTLFDSKGRKFTSSSDATTALLSQDGQDFMLSELQPGIPHRTKTAFKVPKSSLGGRLELEIPEKGFWSSGKVRVLIKE